VSEWFRTDASAEFFRPAARLWSGGGEEYVLLEGARVDVDAQRGSMQSTRMPTLPEGPHRGRIAVAPGEVRTVGTVLNGSVAWCAEINVGTIHVAADDEAGFVHAREVAHAHGGWMLREAGVPADDGYGQPLPNLEVMRRIKSAFDPEHRMNPGRMPL
jgi:hypothetical protein